MFALNTVKTLRSHTQINVMWLKVRLITSYDLLRGFASLNIRSGWGNTSPKWKNFCFFTSLESFTAKQNVDWLVSTPTAWPMLDLWGQYQYWQLRVLKNQSIGSCLILWINALLWRGYLHFYMKQLLLRYVWSQSSPRYGKYIGVYSVMGHRYTPIQILLRTTLQWQIDETF